MQRLSGRTAVVTGGRRGIGAAIANRLEREGARVAVLDIAFNDEDRTSESWASSRIELSCNVSDAAAIEEAFAAVLDEWGKVDILVNNAGIIRDNLLFRMSEEDWDDVIATHLRGSFLASRAAQGSMVEQGYGRIVNISSVSAYGNRGQANYSAAKAGIIGMSKTLAIELAKFGITTNVVAPGFIDTDMNVRTAQRLKVEYEHFVADFSRRHPMGRIGTPEEVAAVVAFLASEDASYVNGQVIDVAGAPSI